MERYYDKYPIILSGFEEVDGVLQQKVVEIDEINF